MNKSRRQPKSLHPCADTVQDEINKEKVGRSVQRINRKSETIRKNLPTLCDDDENESSSDSDNSINDIEDDHSENNNNSGSDNYEEDDDFEPNSSEDDDLVNYANPEKYGRNKKSKPAKKTNSNLVPVDPSLLHLTKIVQVITKNRNQIFEVLDDVNVSPNKLTAEAFQDNTEAIRLLNEIGSSKQSARGPPKESDINETVIDHFRDLETVLKEATLDDDNGYAASSSDSNFSIKSIVENTINMENQSVETTGGELITKIPKIPIRLREMEEYFMREPFPHERPCVCGEKCEGLYIGRNHEIDGFILVEFPSEHDLQYYNSNKMWPPDRPPSKCVLCDRKEINDAYCQFLSGNYIRSNDNPMRFVGKLKYHNKVGPGEYSASDVFITDQNQLNGSVVPVVLYSRIKLMRETRTINKGTSEERHIRAYKQILTDPTSFRAGRTAGQSTSSTSTQH